MIASPDLALNTNPDYIAKYSDTKKAQLLKEIQESQNYPALFGANLKNLNQLTATAASQAEVNRSINTLNEQNFTNEWFRKNLGPYLNSTAQTIKAFQPSFSLFK